MNRYRIVEQNGYSCVEEVKPWGYIRSGLHESREQAESWIKQQDEIDRLAPYGPQAIRLLRELHDVGLDQKLNEIEAFLKNVSETEEECSGR